MSTNKFSQENNHINELHIYVFVFFALYSYLCLFACAKQSTGFTRRECVCVFLIQNIIFIWLWLVVLRHSAPIQPDTASSHCLSNFIILVQTNWILHNALLLLLLLSLYCCFLLILFIFIGVPCRGCVCVCVYGFSLYVFTVFFHLTMFFWFASYQNIYVTI